MARTICLTLIARDEARCIARCLDSAAPFVDEMVVVDTGSADATREIAAAHGARVVGFPWQDDFSLARNFALAQSAAQWHFVLDADEWIESGGEALRAATAQGTEAFVGQVRVRSQFDDDGGVRHAATWISRLIPQGLHYEGAVHEQVVHGLPVRRLPVVIGHDGYRREQQDRKADRNERLLRGQLALRPGDPYLWYQLGKDLEVHERFDAASDAYARARECLAWPPADPAGAQALVARHAWLHDLVVRHIYCAKRAGRYDDALLRVEQDRGWWNHSPDFHFAVGDLLLDLAITRPQEAAALLPRMQESWMRCLELGDAPQLEGSVEGRGSFLAAHNLALLHEMLGNAEAAAAFRRMETGDIGRS